MNLTDHDLKQIDEEYLSKLTVGQLLKLSEKLLDDLRAGTLWVRDRLHQTASNSSRPSGSHVPWEQVGRKEEGLTLRKQV